MGRLSEISQVVVSISVVILLLSIPIGLASTLAYMTFKTLTNFVFNERKK